MLKLFAVRDVKGDSFAAPMAIPTVGIAKRSFLESCADKGSPFGRYPEDYQLYQVGEYEPNSGLLKALPNPLFVMSAVEAADLLATERIKQMAAVAEVK